MTTYRGDIIVGLKFIPGSESSSSSHSHGLSLRKFSIKSNSSASSSNNNNGSSVSTTCSKNTKGSLHVLVKEAKHLSPVKANGNCDAFCKRYDNLYPLGSFVNDVCLNLDFWNSHPKIRACLSMRFI